MKKIVALLLAGLMAASLVGCNNGSTESGSASDTNASVSSGSTADDSWEKIQANGKIIMGVDDEFPPMGYIDTQTGDLIGFDIDLATEVFTRLGVEVDIQPIDWGSKEMELDGGNIDVIWNGYSYTDERNEKVNLSEPYMKNNQVIMVKADSSYQTLEDLAGKSLGVQADSSAEDALNSEGAAEFKASLSEIVPVDNYSKAVLEIKNGLIEAIAIDEVVARYYLSHEEGAYRILTEDNGDVISLAVEDYVIGFRKGDDALKEKVEETLKEMKADGKLAEISEKWFGEDVTTIA